MATTLQLEYKVKADEALASLSEIQNELEQLKRTQAQVQEGSEDWNQLGNSIAALESQVSASTSEFNRLNSIAEGTANTMKQLKSEAKQLENALAGIDPGTEEFTKLSAQLNGVRDKMKDVRESSNLGGSSFEQLSTKASLLRGDVQNLDFAGVGEKLKDLSSSAKSVNFSDFTSGLKEAGKGVVALGRTLLASPIGIFVASIGAIVGALALWKSAANDVDESLENALTSQKLISESEMADVEAVNNKTEQLKAQGKSQKEILELRQKETREAITALEAQLVTQKEIKRQQVESAERNKKILSGILQFITLPLQLLLGGVDMLTEKLNSMGLISDETFAKVGNLRGRMNDSVSSLLFDPEEVAAENDKTIKESEQTLEKLKEQQAGYSNQVADINRQAAEKAAEQRRKNREALEQALEEERDLKIAAIADDVARNKASLDAELADKKANIQAKIDAIKGNSDEEKSTREALLNQIKLLEQNHAIEVKSINDKAAKDKYEAEQLRLQQAREMLEQELALEDEIARSKAERNGDLKELNRLEVEALAASYDAKFELARNNAELEKQLQEELNAQVKEINDKYRKQEEDAEKASADKLLQERLERIQKAADALGEIGSTLSQVQSIIDAYAEENNSRAQAAQEEQTSNLESEYQRRLASVEGNEQATSEVEKLFATKRKALDTKQMLERNERAKADFKRNKAFQIAQATISGATSVLQAYASQLSVPTIDAPIRGAIAAAAAGAMAIAQIAAIARTKFQGESGGAEGASSGSFSGAGSSSAPSAGEARPMQFSTATQTQQQGAVIQSQPARVYVVESDILDVSSQRQRRENKATVVE